MKKLLLIAITLSTLMAFQTNKNKEIFICKTVKSKRYHLDKNCKGLKKCKSKITKTTIKKAEKVGMILCKWED